MIERAALIVIAPTPPVAHAAGQTVKIRVFHSLQIISEPAVL
jgi:hypothetical protein